MSKTGPGSGAWWDVTWNPISGCSHSGTPGCDNCWARGMAKRLAGRFGYPESPDEFDVTFHPDKLDEPLRWRKPRAVFVCSMGDLFHEDVSDEQITSVLGITSISGAPFYNHVFLLLTKRPQRMREYAAAHELLWSQPHVWPGVTVENQDQMWRVEQLLQIPAAKRFVSFEPLLGPIDMWSWVEACNKCPGTDDCPYGRCINWTDGTSLSATLDGVIVGGESGPGARPMHPDWARGIRDQCVEAGAPFTFKQWGEWEPGQESTEPFGPVEIGERCVQHGGRVCRMYRVGKKAAGRELDGVVWDQWPWEVL